MTRLRLGVNIDHVATIRNARGGRHPDPVRAAKLAIAAGADGITAHLREDRRHIRDDDIARLKAEIDKPLNFEMAATDEMVDDRAARPGRTPPAWCRKSAPSAPPKAGSTRPGSARSLRRSSRRSSMPASACRCSSRPSRRRSRRRPSSARR